MINLFLGRPQDYGSANMLVKEVNLRELTGGLFGRLFYHSKLREVKIGQVFFEEKINPIWTLCAVTKRRTSGRSSLRIIEDCLLSVIHYAHQKQCKRVVIPVLGLGKAVSKREVVKLFYRILGPDPVTYVIATTDEEFIRLMNLRAMIDNVMMPFFQRNADYKRQ